jgi:hypothetical protein
MNKAESNIRAVCDAHAPKPDAVWAKKAPEWFIGKWVKKAFDITPYPGWGPKIEHMWVKVTGVEDGKLVGTMANAPQFVRNLKFGDKAVVSLEEISAMSKTAD